MRFGFRTVVVASLSLLLAMACVGGGENQCLNPQPDLPSCRNSGGPGSKGGATGTTAGGSNNGNSFAGSSSVGVAGSGTNLGNDAGQPMPPESAAGSSGDFGGQGGDSAIEPGALAGAGGAAGAAGSDGP